MATKHSTRYSQVFNPTPLLKAIVVLSKTPQAQLTTHERTTIQTFENGIIVRSSAPLSVDSKATPHASAIVQTLNFGCFSTKKQRGAPTKLAPATKPTRVTHRPAGG